MKLSELRHAIREMIVSELMEVDTDPKSGAVVMKKTANPADIKKLTAQGIDVQLIPEDQLNEFAAFYKIKDDVDQEEAKAAIDKAIQDNPRQKNLQIALRILRDEEKVNFEKLAKALGVKSVATFNNQDSRKVLDGDLAPFISSSRLKDSEPLVPKEPEEPKEKGVPGRKKGSTKPSNALAYTMTGDVSISGKDPSKSLIKRAVKAARSVQPISTIDTTDLDAVEAQLMAINSEIQTKLPKAKEIAAKGNIKNYSEEEAAFMDDFRAKGDLRRQLIATRDKIASKKVRR